MTVVGDGSLEQYLMQPIGAISNLPSLTGGATFDNDWSWSTPANVTLGVKAGATATISFVKNDTLFEYTDGLSDPEQVEIKTDGAIYAKFEFAFNIGVSASGTGQVGAVGIKGSVEGGTAFTIGYYCAIDTAITMKDALVKLFSSIVLPFGEDTVIRMNAGEYLQYQFTGTLGLGLGVTYGVSGALLSGRSVAEVSQSFGNGIVTAGLKLKPEYQVGASLDIKFDYTDTFEVFVHKISAAEAKLHLLRMDRSKLTSDLKAEIGISVSQDSNVDLSVNASAVNTSIQNYVTGRISDPATKSAAQKAVGAALDKAQTEIDKYIKDASDRANNLLHYLDNKKLQLEWLLEQTESRTAIFTYDFKVSDTPEFRNTWTTAMKGDFRDALQAAPAGTVTLDSGSGVADEFARRTTLSLNFFGLYKASSITNYFKSNTITYAGNGIFDVVFVTGKEFEVQSKNKSSATHLAFTAKVSEDAAGNVSQADVVLAIRLADTHNPRTAAQSGTILDHTAAEQAAVAIQKIKDTGEDPNATVVLECQILPSAYTRVRSTTYDGDQPVGDLTLDAANYSDFVLACHQLGVTYPTASSDFPTFVAWQEFSRQVNGTSYPTRTLRGNDEPGNWPANWLPSDSAQRLMADFYINAARQYMNFCADIRVVGSLSATVQSEKQFRQLQNRLDAMVHNDVPDDLTRPLLLAFLYDCVAQAKQVTIEEKTVNGAPTLTITAVFG